MKIVELICLCLMFFLSIICTRSDMKKGIIYNKVLFMFVVFSIFLDLIYYGYYAKDLFFEFLLNFIFISIVSLYLFYSHSFAGGDCKMIIVLSLLYPARYYLVYRNTNLTLVFVIGFAIFSGYIYLLLKSIWSLVVKKVTVTLDYVKNYLLNFSNSFVTAMVYIALLNCILMIGNYYGLYFNLLIVNIICLFVAWCVGKYQIFREKIILSLVVCLVVFISIIFKTVPISLIPGSYTLVIILLFCQMTISTSIYENININQLKKGMILSTFSSLLMQSSITKGLPKVSTEDLKSRLTDTEVESIKIWAKATKTESLTIVSKIPFAIFISIGFLSYFMLGAL